jgi:hypothetical protein
MDISDINYEWGFNPLQSYPTSSGQNDVVFMVHWQLYGTTGSIEDGTYYSGGVIGVQPVEYNSGSDFISFNDLTKDIVYGWVTASMGQEKVDSYYENIKNQIQDKITPKAITQQAPWITGSIQ